MNDLVFKLSDDGMKLLAVIQPCEDKIELTVEEIKRRIKESSLDYLFINEYLLVQLVQRYKEAAVNETIEFEIGERRDAICSVAVSDDKMTVHLSITSNFGGKGVSLADIQALLTDRGIVFGVVNFDTVEQMLEKEYFADFLIAQGRNPVDGVDTVFLSVVPEAEVIPVRKPLVNPDGSVDYRELGNIIMVQKGNLLMQRIPPIPGEPGRNVFNEIVEPGGGVDIPFTLDQRGVYVNPEDKNQLLAAITGQPILVPHGMIVSSVLTINSVDLSSGNIRFEGSVIVAENVESAMTLKATENITIEGNVTNARVECTGDLLIRGNVNGNCELQAGGNVVIEGGAQGNATKPFSGPDKRKRQTPQLPRTVKFERRKRTNVTYPTKITARGSIHVDFIENFKVEAGIDIVINKYSMNNELMAANSILIGSKGDKKSSIIGGITWAMMLVRTFLIGIGTGMKTKVQAGSNPYVSRRIAEIKELLLQSHDERQNIHKILAWISENPEKSEPELLARLHHTLSRLTIDAEEYERELKDLLSNLKVISGAKIISERGAYVGTEIKVNKASWKVSDNLGKSTFVEQKNKVVVLKDS